MSPRRGTLVELLTIAGFCAFLFYFGLNTFGLVGADEPRYAQIAREMLDRGDWVTPTLYGKPWLEKPPLYYWRAMAAYIIFGVSDWSARLPAATAATLMVFVVYFFARRFLSGAQLNAALMTASSAGVIGFARGAGTDMQLAATFVIAMLGWYAWFATKRRLWLAGFYLFLAFGTLSKGPVAPLLAVLIIVIFAAVRRDLRLVWKTLWLPGILVFLAVVLPWYVAVQLRNSEFFRGFFLEHNFARFATNLYRHRQPFWYYIPVLFLGVMPWSALVIAGMVEAGRDWRRRARENVDTALPAFLLTWVAVLVVFFSLSMSKLPGYILPAFPPCAMLAANYLRGREQLGWPISVAQAALSAVLLGATLLYPNILLHRSGAIPPSAKLVAGGIAALLFLATLSGLRRQGTRVLRLVVLAPVIVGLAFLLRVAGPSIDEAFSLRPVAKELDRMGTDRKQLAVFKASRIVEYGLAFYENRGLARYERGEIPAGDHLVVTTEGARAQLQQRVGARRLSRLGGFPPQRLEYFWVSTPAPTGHLHR